MSVCVLACVSVHSSFPFHMHESRIRMLLLLPSAVPAFRSAEQGVSVLVLFSFYITLCRLSHASPWQRLCRCEAELPSLQELTQVQEKYERAETMASQWRIDGGSIIIMLRQQQNKISKHSTQNEVARVSESVGGFRGGS